MGFAHRLLYPVVNATWGASLGTCAALLAYRLLRSDSESDSDSESEADTESE